MTSTGFKSILELTRGDIVESIHFGAVVVSDGSGKVIAWYGDPDLVTFVRSSAKPFQALPLLENCGQGHYKLTPREIALICASHSGTDEQVSVLNGIQQKANVNVSELLCGMHQPVHKPTAETMRDREEELTQNRHNCSGKHTGMLAYVRMKENSGEDIPEGMEYIDPYHPVQQEILSTFAYMCDLPENKIAIGTDGCSAPNFGLPLRNVALAYARLADPEFGLVLPEARVAACRTVTSAMTAHPDMVGGPGRFDTTLMEICRGRVLAKGGAEGYQGLSVLPDAVGPGSPALGIVIKIADGDRRNSVRSAVALEVLKQLEVLSDQELDALSGFGPIFPISNWRGIVVGEARPIFTLNFPKK